MAHNWFPHDSTAHNDQKILLIREKYGWEGYGLYWALLEAMYETVDAKLDTNVIRALYIRFTITPEKMKEFIEFCKEIELLKEEDGALFSQRLVADKEKMIEKSEAAKKAVSMRRDRRSNKRSSTNVQRTYNERSTPTLPVPTRPDQVSMSANADSDTLDEFEAFVLWLNSSGVFPSEKKGTGSARKKWKSRRSSYSAKDIKDAFSNLVNEPDKWKINNNGFRPLAWWLHSDDRIEDMLYCHLKGNKPRLIISQE